MGTNKGQAFQISRFQFLETWAATEKKKLRPETCFEWPFSILAALLRTGFVSVNGKESIASSHQYENHWHSHPLRGRNLDDPRLSRHYFLRLC